MSTVQRFGRSDGSYNLPLRSRFSLLTVLGHPTFTFTNTLRDLNVVETVQYTLFVSLMWVSFSDFTGGDRFV